MKIGRRDVCRDQHYEVTSTGIRCPSCREAFGCGSILHRAINVGADRQPKHGRPRSDKRSERKLVAWDRLGVSGWVGWGGGLGEKKADRHTRGRERGRHRQTETDEERKNE